MYDEWKPIYSALVTDIMDQLGYRDQAMTPDIRPSRPAAFIAGTGAHYRRVCRYQPSTPIPTAKFLPPTIKLAPATSSSLPLSRRRALRPLGRASLHGCPSSRRRIRAHRRLGPRCAPDERHGLPLLLQRLFAARLGGHRILAKTIKQPITCGGVQVHLGDFILADYDGVAVIPAAIKGEVADEKAMEKLAGENVVRDELAAATVAEGGL